MPATLFNRVRGRIQRGLARRTALRLFQIEPREAVVSFTFDDFPRSALHEGGAILRSFGWTGTYYASFGLMGRTIATGEIFCEEDLPELLRQGHELGCHTFDHCDSWETPADEFRASINRNASDAARLLPGIPMSTFSYPISTPHPANKRVVSAKFSCARWGGQQLNIGETDSNLLQAFFIEQSRDDEDAIRRMIDAAVATKGWLIFATHDICDSPTRFGCTPKLFRRVVEHVAASGALVLPMQRALDQLHKPDARLHASQN